MVSSVEKIKQLKSNIDSSIELLEYHLDIAKKCLGFELDDDLAEKLKNYSKIISELLISLSDYKDRLNNGKIHPNSVVYFVNLAKSIQGQLPYRSHVGSKEKMAVPQINHANQYGTDLTQSIEHIKSEYKKLQFVTFFFEKLGFFESNVTAVGANGSGKSTIVTKLKESLQNDGVIIPAQKILHIAQNNSINNPSSTANELKQFQIMDKSSRTGNIGQTQKEFSAVINNLLSDDNAINSSYRKEATLETEKGQSISPPPVSRLDKTLSIWNSLIEHRTMECLDGFNITLRYGDNAPYSANAASDGEKVLLYIIGHVLQAPENGFIVVDEPEMYLNKAIVSKIWDRLEKERPDCVFIYLTHDIEFASSRIDSKKLWIKSYEAPETWEIEDIPQNNIPESLILEVLGSRKNILFCEGEVAKVDETILNLLFPNLSIKPVGSCENVINYAKALNQLDNVQLNAFGLIDSDHQPAERLASLAENSIYHLEVAEIENLLLDETLISKLSERLMCTADTVDNIKSKISEEFEKEIELQASNYVSSYIDFVYKNTNYKKGNKLAELHKNFQDFNAQINIPELYESRVARLKDILTTKSYHDLLKAYNNKGLKKIVNNELAIKDFTQRMIRLIKQEPELVKVMYRYFPEQIITANQKN